MTTLQQTQNADTTRADPLSDYALELKDLNKIFYQGGVELEILKNVSFGLRKGEMVALLGPSGSGKSTLLQIAGLLDRASSGEIIIDGQKMSGLSDLKRTRIRRHKIGFIYQFHHLLPEFSALENLIVPQMIAGTGRRQAEINARDMLSRLNISDRADHRPARLSGGEQQRVAIGRALINDPQILLADEPTGNLDPGTSELIFDLLLGIIRDRNVAGFIATHNVGLARKMDRVCELQDGTLKQATLS